MRILLVDDNHDSLQSLNVVLSDLGHEPVPLANAAAALELAQTDFFPLVITDIRMPGMDGLELLERLRASPGGRDTDIVLITGHGDMETAIEALRKGAYDYLNKPINARELAAVVDRSAEHQALMFENRDLQKRMRSRVIEATHDIRESLAQVQDKLRQVVGIGEIIARSPAMEKLLRETSVYHNDPAVPVLLEGETGTGKEILARLIHYGENTVDTPFVAINCSAIPTHLFESELLGHEAGAYTGSTKKGAKGKLELAENGTLFLDEIAEMPLEMQPKLLRILEERAFYRVGGLKKRDFRARVICAANRNLEALLDSGQFRRDLYHRLKVGHMSIPPLRERPEDIEPMARFFLTREAKKKKKKFTEISEESLDILLKQEWPGNVRELENTIERVVLTCEGETILPGHLSFLFNPKPAQAISGAPAPAPSASAPINSETMMLPEASLNLEEFNQTIILRALEKFKGNKTKAAEYLGMSRYALHRRLQKN